MTVLAKSFVFEGLGFDEHHMALDGFVSFQAGAGFAPGPNCIRVDGREATAPADGASCIAINGTGTTMIVTDPSTCLDT